MTDLGAVLGALGAVAVLAAGRRATLLAGFVVVAAAEVVLAHAGGLHISTKLVAAAVLGVLVLAALAALLLRAPWLVTPLVLVTAPFRLPLDFGSNHRFYVAIAHGGQLGRLLPLYVVLAVSVLATAWRAIRREPIGAIRREIALPAAAFIAFASISLLWSEDVGSGRSLLEYFLLPFAILVVVVARAPFPERLPRVLGVLSVALALLFAAVGLVEAATHRLIFYAHNLQVSNTYTSFFRVTSLFRDPSLYGRHLVLGLAIVVVCMWLRKLDVVPAAAIIAILFAGLYFSYSQSSYAALFVVVLGPLVPPSRLVSTVCVS